MLPLCQQPPHKFWMPHCCGAEPYLGWPQDLVLGIQHNHAMLLPADTHTPHFGSIHLRQSLPGCLDCALQDMSHTTAQHNDTLSTHIIITGPTIG